MRLRQNIIVITLLALAIGAMAIGAGAQNNSEDPKTIEVNLYYRIGDSILAPAVYDDPSERDFDVTKSVFFSVVRYVDPRTHVAYDKSAPTFNFDIKDLRHSFRLEKKTFLLGEPILVEHRIELNGPGELEWFIGGNYRSRGRDDNFSFVLRGADDAIVPDPYPKITGLVMGGGFGSTQTIKKDKPLSYWLGLQRYSAITKPGRYDLYCFTGSKQATFGRIKALQAALPKEIANDHYVDDSGDLIDKKTGERSKRYALETNEHRVDSAAKWSIKELVPDEVYQYARDQGIGLSFSEPGLFGTVAHFRITIVEGTRSEREEMIARWSALAAFESNRNLMGSQRAALFEAIWYLRQDSFLPLLEEWIVKNTGVEDPFPRIPMYLGGLAMSPDRAAFRVLLKASPEEITNAFYYLHEDHIAAAIPLCIDYLTHPDSRVRATAESRLIYWTRQSFEHKWNGYDYQRPTLEEGESMQHLWRIWWENNSKSFNPHELCESPCKALEKSSQ